MSPIFAYNGEMNIEWLGMKKALPKALSSDFLESRPVLISNPQLKPEIKAFPAPKIFGFIIFAILFSASLACLFSWPDRFWPGLLASPGFAPLPPSSHPGSFPSFLQKTELQTKPQPPPPPLLVTDSLQRKVKIPSRVTRLLSLQPEITRIVVSLGAGQTLVGIDRFLRFEDHHFSLIFPPASDLPLVALSDESINAEVILRFKPELVFTSPSEPLLTDSLSRKLSIPVVALSSLGRFDLLLKEIEVVGRALGQEARARELISYFEDKLTHVKTLLAAEAKRPRPRVYLAFWSSLVMTPVTYEPVKAAGGQNMAEGLIPSYLGTARTVVSLEQLLDWNPEIILVHGNYPPAERQVTRELILNDRRLASLEAVKRGRVFYTFGFWYWWDLAEALFEVYYLASLFYPELRPKLNLQKEGEEIFTKFYGSSAAFHHLLNVLKIDLQASLKEELLDGNS